MQALLKQGKCAEALGETRSLTVEGDPAAAEVLLVRADALYGSGNLERAVKIYEEVCALVSCPIRQGPHKLHLPQ